MHIHAHNLFTSMQTMCVRYGLDPFLHYLKMPGDNPCALGVGAPKPAPVARKKKISIILDTEAMTRMLHSVSKKKEAFVRRVETREVPTGLVTMGQKRLWDFIHRETHRTDVKTLGFDIDNSGRFLVWVCLRFVVRFFVVEILVCCSCISLSFHLFRFFVFFFLCFVFCVCVCVCVCVVSRG